MGKQRTFAGIAWSQKGKVTRREQFDRAEQHHAATPCRRRTNSPASMYFIFWLLISA
jgi:hypothetical protein